MTEMRKKNWFEKLTGFQEAGYDETRRQLALEGSLITSLENGRSYSAGTLELPSLASLRQRVEAGSGAAGRLRVTLVSGDVRAMHREPGNVGALFQVASQFNMLEMISPDRTPADGVSIYEGDPTQGPACAMAAGAATIFRNYFAPVDGVAGQTRDRQLDGLAELGAALSAATARPVASLWKMQNGYALCTRQGLDRIARYLGVIDSRKIDALRGLLRVGLHSDVEVTDAAKLPGPLVSQAFCSALPVTYTRVPSIHWTAFATLVLEAAYEATLWAAVLNARRGISNVVFLTRLGGGAFGNDEAWIHGAIARALHLAAGFDLDVRIVSRGTPSVEVTQLVSDFST